jgi:hypothetical protein
MRRDRLEKFDLLFLLLPSPVLLRNLFAVIHTRIVYVSITDS